MSWLDISTYLVQNGTACLVIFGMSSFVFHFAFSSCAHEGNLARNLPSLIIAFVFANIIGVVTLIPSHERVMAVKIERIKNEAVNKDNIQKGVETLERIGKKLECKYLGCEDEPQI